MKSPWRVISPSNTLWPRFSPYPSVVLESGWSESWTQLCNDRKIWSEGTDFGVKLIILVKMFRQNNVGAMRAKVEITSYDAQGLESTFTEVGYICFAVVF